MRTCLLTRRIASQRKWCGLECLCRVVVSKRRIFALRLASLSSWRFIARQADVVGSTLVLHFTHCAMLCDSSSCCCCCCCRNDASPTLRRARSLLDRTTDLRDETAYAVHQVRPLFTPHLPPTRPSAPQTARKHTNTLLYRKLARTDSSGTSADT